MHGLVIRGMHAWGGLLRLECSVLVELKTCHSFHFQGTGREEADARTFRFSCSMAVGNPSSAAVSEVETNACDQKSP